MLEKFDVIAYQKENGESPVKDFIYSLDPKMQAKMIGLLDLLAEKGNELRAPYSKHLEDGIFELRCKVGSNISRVMYFFYYHKIVVLTNGFIKKTQKTPSAEIKLAKKRRQEFLARMEEEK